MAAAVPLVATRGLSRKPYCSDMTWTGKPATFVEIQSKEKPYRLCCVTLWRQTETCWCMWGLPSFRGWGFLPLCVCLFRYSSWILGGFMLHILLSRKKETPETSRKTCLTEKESASCVVTCDCCTLYFPDIVIRVLYCFFSLPPSFYLLPSCLLAVSLNSHAHYLMWAWPAREGAGSSCHLDERSGDAILRERPRVKFARLSLRETGNSAHTVWTIKAWNQSLFE